MTEQRRPIDPRPQDVGRAVVYVPFGDVVREERGVVSSFNSTWVFVRYAGQPGSRATARSDLRWAEPKDSDL